jgi:hypothetical protein
LRGRGWAIPVFENPVISRKISMLYKVGRLLQLIGLIILPVAISGNMAEKLDLRESLGLSGIGILIFFIGWMVQQSGRRA